MGFRHPHQVPHNGTKNTHPKKITTFSRASLHKNSELAHILASSLQKSRAERFPVVSHWEKAPFGLTIKSVPPCGGMGERLKPAVLKTVEPERAPGVRIPLPPPLTCPWSFSLVRENPQNTR